MPKLKNPSKSQLMNMADREFSRYWITKIGKCERCARKNIRLELAHFKSRDYKCTRYDRENTFVLCGGINKALCHPFFHANPDLFKDFFIKRRGEFMLKYLNKKISLSKPLGIEYYQAVYNKYKKLNEDLSTV